MEYDCARKDHLKFRCRQPSHNQVIRKSIILEKDGFKAGYQQTFREINGARTRIQLYGGDE